MTRKEHLSGKVALISPKDLCRFSLIIVYSTLNFIIKYYL